MYTRYVPQPDGSYHRNRMDDVQVKPAPPPPPQEHETVKPQPPERHDQRQTMGIGSFFRQILPKGFDTGDLIVVLLLLLMAADRQEEQNTALLTLALYLFL